jgi:murein DD-endopeptidase MepM/ murein hydrolase activator NlpD
MPAAASAEGWRCELQILPGAAGARARYVRFSRAALAGLSLAALLYLAAVALALAVAPGAITGLFNSREYRNLAAERAGQGARVGEMVSRLDRLATSAEELRFQLAKVGLAYGLPPAGVPGAAAPIDAATASIYSAAIARGGRLEARLRGQLAALDALLAQAQAYEALHADEVRSTPALCPLRGHRFVLMSPYGGRRNPFSKGFETHFGVDLAAPPGTPIAAPADGVVLFAGTYPLDRSLHWWRYGNLVAVRHGQRFVTLFGHCQEVAVKAGDLVRQGQPLATVGSSGWSVSPHLHYEVRRIERPGGEPHPVDPLVYILDHRWQNEERLLARAAAPAARGFEPLPPGLLAGHLAHLAPRHRRGRL